MNTLKEFGKFTEFRNLYEFEQAVKQEGYNTAFDYCVDGDQYVVDYMNDKNDLIVAYAETSEEFINDLEHLDPNTSYARDSRRCKLISYEIEMPYVHHNIENVNSGFSVDNNSREDFKKAMYILHNPIHWAQSLYNVHFYSINSFIKHHGHILEKYNFNRPVTNILSYPEEFGYAPTVLYTLPDSTKEVRLWTDFFTTEFHCNIDLDNFEEDLKKYLNDGKSTYKKSNTR